VTAALSRLAPFARFLPAVAALGAWLFWLGASGGYFPRDYLPVALLAIALLAVLFVATGIVLPPRGPGRTAVLLLAVGACLSLLSMAWADSPAFAFDASMKLIAILAVTWLIATVPWSDRSAATMLGAWAVGAALVALVALVDVATGSGSIDVVRYGRFAEPIGYTNGVAALGVMAFLPGLALASRREVPALAQGVLLAAACFLAELALLPQSRAAIVAIAVGLPLLVVISPGRLALLARLAVLALAVGFALGHVLDVYTAASNGEDAMAALRSATVAMTLSSVLAGFAGAALGLAQGTVESRVRLPRPTRRTVLGLLGAALLVLVVAGFANSGRIETAWDKATNASANDSGSRISSLDPEERLDYWRVSLDMFDRSPVLGRGAGSFEYNYARDRHEAKPSRYTHNVFLRALGETGLVGLLLFVAMLATLALGAYRARRALSPLGATVAGAAFVVGVCFLLHASFDWMEEIPALAAPAIGLLVMVCRSVGGDAEPGRQSRGLIAAGTAVALAAAVLIGTSWLTVLYLQRGDERLATDPAGAFSDYSRAADLEPWSAKPLLSEGVGAIVAGEPRRARAAFVAAVEREDDAFPHLELALLAAQQHRHALAVREVGIAARIEPRDILARYAQRQIEAGKPIDARSFNRRLLGIEERRFTSPVS
jgi:hypothetical protein